MLGLIFAMLCFMARGRAILEFWVILMKEKNATLGQRLYALRKYRNLSLQELADETGISRSNLNRYERDTSKPTTEYLKMLCRFYRVSSDYLLFGMQGDALKREGWAESDPELKEMLQRLVKVMTSGEPHVRSWAIIQFGQAFGGKQS